MKKVTVAQRILIMIVVSALSLLVVGAVGLGVANAGKNNMKQITEGTMVSTGLLGEARQAFMETRVYTYAHVLNTDEAAMRQLEESINANSAKLEKLLKDYEKLAINDEDRKLLAVDVSNAKTYLDFVHNQVLPKSRANENEAARELLVNQGSMFGKQTLKGLDDHVAFHIKNSDQTVKEALVKANNNEIIAFVTIVVGLLLIGILGFRLAGEIRRRMNNLSQTMIRVYDTLDFTVRISISRQDELGASADAFNKLIQRLHDNLQSIAAGAHSVASAASQMTSTSHQVATAAHQQSEAASGMAATVEEMTVSINHVADRAQEANRISSESGQLAHSGEKVIGQTASDIQDIAATVNDAAELIHGLEQHSQQIANVVAVIKEVADQTNLLALNAAIEAARAGEQGRGFAVVADEVRKLAERTASSTQEIAHTIDTMRASAGDAVASMEGVVSKVNLGVERAQEANTSMAQIGEGSRKAVGMVEEIASAIREQGAATNNIAVQVEKIAQMSEQSSAAASEGARAAQDLDRLATEMQKVVSAYRL